MIVVEDVLDGGDRVIQVSFVEVPILPALGKIPELMLGVGQAVAVAMGEMPCVVTTVEIVVYAFDHGSNRARLIRSVWRAVLCVSGCPENESG